MNIQLTPRVRTELTDFDESLIKSGDTLVIMRMDGLDPLIMYGTGTHVGHCVMAMWYEDGLYVIESQDAWYWPRKGIQRNKFKQWLTWAKNADFHVVHLPLTAEARHRFDIPAAKEFYAETEGLPYGFHNFIFSWIDTPKDNLPPLFPDGIVPVVFSIMEKIVPKVIDIFVNQALNKRLDTTGLNLEQVIIEAGKRGRTIEDLFADVEKDGWEYHGIEPRDGRSYVCSTFLVAVYNAAGLFKPYTINSPEFTPKDLYQLNFFDKNWS